LSPSYVSALLSPFRPVVGPSAFGSLAFDCLLPSALAGALVGLAFGKPGVLLVRACSGAPPVRGSAFATGAVSALSACPYIG